MIGRLWPWAVALLIFLGVGYFVVDNQGRTDARNARNAVETCYLAKAMAAGQDPAVYRPPPAVREECTRPMREWEASYYTPFYIGAGAGVIAALLFLAVVLGWRRATGGGAEE